MADPSWPVTFGTLTGNQPASLFDLNFAEATQVTTRANTPQTPLPPKAGGEVGTDGYSAPADHRHPPQPATPTTIAGTSYDLSGDNDGGVLEFTAGTDVTVTVPLSLPTNFSCLICQAGAGRVQVVGATGVTIRNSSGYSKSRTQWSEMSLRVRSNTGVAAEAVISGDMGA